LVLLNLMYLEVVSGCRGVSGDLFWEGSVGCELRILRYHYNIWNCVPKIKFEKIFGIVLTCLHLGIISLKLVIIDLVVFFQVTFIRTSQQPLDRKIVGSSLHRICLKLYIPMHCNPVIINLL
jgi:hypothetical protein